ncbi:MAG: mannose-1-phosphate guanylyltransferase [Clostridium sp.]
MLCALIMAGGKGTRFWPLSTEEKPKQFLNLIGNQTMIQMTVNRIKPIIPIERVFVCTGEKYKHLVMNQLPELPERNIIIEPDSRNTAPCIALSSFIINRYYKDSTMVVLPADHLINDEENFRDTIQDGYSFIKENKNAIVTLGMRPSRPETGYGYIKYSSEYEIVGCSKVIKVDAFVEKPNELMAQQYIESQDYLWNGGVFIWNTNNILSQIEQYSKMTYQSLASILECDDESMKEIINNNYKYTEAISIDYAVLEKSKDIYVIPSDFGWDDVGSWEAIDRYKEKDILGNILIGNGKVIEAQNNMIISSSSDIVIDGLSDIYVIENDGKIIIGNKSNISRLKDLKKIIS